MADNIKKVTIKFDLDTSGMENGGRKATAVLNTQKEAVSKITKSYSLLEQAEKARVQQIEAQEVAFGKLAQKINALQNNTKLNQPLFEGAAKASVTAFNKSLDETNAKLALTEERIKVLKFATNLGVGSTPYAQAPTTRDNSFSASSGLSVNTKTKTQVAAEEAILREGNERLRKITLDTANDTVRQQDIANKRRISSYEKMFANIEAQEKAFADKIKSARFAMGEVTSVRKDNRGYEVNAKGTVADNRAKAAKALADEQRLVDERLRQTLAKEDARAEAHAVHQQKLAQETAARKLSILQNQIQTEEQFKEAARNRDLAQLRRDILQREALRQENISKQVSTLQTNLQGSNAALQANIDKQIAIERYGIKSIEVARIEAANRTRLLQEQLSNYIARQQERVAQGTISAAGAIQRITRAQNQHTEGVLRANKALNAQEKALGSNVRQHDALLLRVGKLIISYNILRNVWGQFIQSLRNIPIAGMAQQANQAPILAIFGTAEGQKNLRLVGEVAKSTGQDLAGLETSYAKFATSAVLAGEKQANVNSIFKDFAEVGAVFNLTQDKMDSVFLALDQMYGKGTVQSEELKKQLGNVLPGAVEIAAQAWAKYTDSADKSIGGFLKAMKNGLVNAKDLVPQYAQLYRDIAGGKDDSVFKTIGDRLSFQLGRLRNEYTELNRDIFDSTQRTMVSLVRITASALSSIKENLAGIGQTIEIIAGLLTFRLGVAAVLALGNITALIAKLGVFTRIVTGISAPVLALVGAIGYLYTEISGLSLGYDKAIGYTITYKDKTVGLINYVKAVAIVTLDRLSFSLDSVYTAFDRLKQIPEDIISRLLPNSRDIAEFSAFVKTLQSDFFVLPSLRGEGDMKGSDISATYEKNLKEALAGVSSFQSDAINKAEELGMADYIEKFRGKSVQLVIDAVAAGKLKTHQDITKALALTSEIAAPELETTASGPDSNAAKAGRAAGQSFSKEYLAALKKISKEGQNYVREQERALKLLDIAYGRNEESLVNYYEKKQQLELASIENQLLDADESLQLAKQNKDLQRIEEFEAKKQELFIKTQTVQDDIDNQRYEAEKQYAALIRTTNEQYLTYLGETDKALTSSANAQYFENIKIALENENDALAEQLIKLNKAEVTKGKIINLDERRKRISDQLALQEQRIHNQMQAGYIDLQSGNEQLFAIRTQQLEVLDAEIAKVSRLLALNSEDVSTQEKLLDLQRERAGIAENKGGIERQRYKGDFSFISDFQDQKAKLDISEKIDTQNLNVFPDKSGELYGAKLENQLKIDKDYALRAGENYANLFGGIANLGSSTFQSLAEANAKMYGAQSKEARKAFALYKATKMAEIAISTAGAVMNALATSSNIYVGIALAAVAGAIGAIQLSQVASQQPPAAHGGLDYVPKEQTYLLDKGERVLSPRQNKDLTSYINNSTINNTQSKNVNNIRIINSVDPSVMRDYIGSTEGEEVIMNVVRRNQEAA